MTSSDANVRMMTAPAPTPAYQEDNVAKLQRVSITHQDASVLFLSSHNRCISLWTVHLEDLIRFPVYYGNQFF